MHFYMHMWGRMNGKKKKESEVSVIKIKSRRRETCEKSGSDGEGRFTWLGDPNKYKFC